MNNKVKGHKINYKKVIAWSIGSSLVLLSLSIVSNKLIENRDTVAQVKTLDQSVYENMDKDKDYHEFLERKEIKKILPSLKNILLNDNLPYPDNYGFLDFALENINTKGALLDRTMDLTLYQAIDLKNQTSKNPITGECNIEKTSPEVYFVMNTPKSDTLYKIVQNEALKICNHK